MYGFVPLILGRAAPGPNFDMIPNLQSHGQGFSPIPAGGSLLGVCFLCFYQKTPSQYEILNV